MTDDKIKGARTELGAIIERRKRLEQEAEKAQQAHSRAAAVLAEASDALHAIIDRDAAQDADAAARLAETIRAGGDASLDGQQQDHAERLLAERRVAVAQGACDALARDLSDAVAAVAAARSDAQAAAKAVLIAYRDQLTDELNAKTREFLDAQHRLMGLLDSTLVPTTPAAAGATQEVYRSYPPSMHPAPFAGRAWNALSTALLDDSEAVFVPIAPSVPTEVVTPQMQRVREQKKAHDAERAANAEKLAAEMKAYTQADLIAERYGHILIGGGS